MTISTRRRDKLGRWVVPPIAFEFNCKECGEYEIRTRHPCGAKPRLCRSCQHKRKSVYDRIYYHTVYKSYGRIDTSDIPEASADWWKRARLVMP
jgi:hypothetical protein